MPLISLQSKFYFSLFLDRKIWGELCMYFELQVGSPWTNLGEIWPNCCQMGYLQNRVSANFNSSFRFKVIAYFYWRWLQCTHFSTDCFSLVSDLRSCSSIVLVVKRTFAARSGIYCRFTAKCFLPFFDEI